ncbi:hypothetical protein COO60DRAFT_1116784 [Scenedesmus sp. NREL 46B-D3]|nr:hypothetical protein COO60DRAFT_1116784 [Scenedesmus sp. NREL 46B-D3]
MEAAWAACISKIHCGEAPTQAETAAVCSSGLVEVLATLMYEQLEGQLQLTHVKAFWEQLVASQLQPAGPPAILLPALQALAAAVRQQSQQLSSFAQQLLLGVVQQAQQQHQQQQPDPNAAAAAAAVMSSAKASWQEAVPASTVALLAGLCLKHRTAVASILMATAPLRLPSVLQQYYRRQLLQLCDAIQQQQAAAGNSSSEGGDDAMSEGPGSADLHSPNSAAGSSPDRVRDAAHGARQGVGAAAAAAAAAQLPDPQALLGPDWCAAVAATSACMEDLGLAAASEEAYTAVINSYVLRQLRTLATGELTSSVLPRAQQLVCAGPLAFLQVLLGPGHSTIVKLQEWQLRLTYLMLETLGALRASDMFDIVIDYPDSAPALSDLALCLAHTNMAAQFAATFKSSLQQRLLHAGAATSDIIHTYVSTIRAMRQLGRSGLLLDTVSEPIRAYLRSRPDTIRCIVSMLTEDNHDQVGGSGSSLLQELQAQQQQQPGGTGSSAAGGGSGAGFGPATGSGLGPGGLSAAVGPPSAVAALSNAGSGKAGARVMFNWCVSEAEGDDAALRLLEALQAAPADATAAAGDGPGLGGEGRAAAGSDAEQATALLGLPHARSAAAAAASSALLSGGRVAADVVSMLIGIYGGPLLFMEEYRLMLADRLLAKDEYDCQREIMTLELLKIRCMLSASGT